MCVCERERERERERGGGGREGGGRERERERERGGGEGGRREGERERELHTVAMYVMIKIECSVILIIPFLEYQCLLPLPVVVSQSLSGQNLLLHSVLCSPSVDRVKLNS